MARALHPQPQEKGFGAIAIEGDWPEAERVNRWIRGMGDDATAEQALSGFQGFPSWMWANQEIRDLAVQLRAELSRQFDAVIHLDRTAAVTPLLR